MQTHQFVFTGSTIGNLRTNGKLLLSHCCFTFPKAQDSNCMTREIRFNVSKKENVSYLNMFCIYIYFHLKQKTLVAEFIRCICGFFYGFELMDLDLLSVTQTFCTVDTRLLQYDFKTLLNCRSSVLKSCVSCERSSSSSSPWRLAQPHKPPVPARWENIC